MNIYSAKTNLGLILTLIYRYIHTYMYTYSSSHSVSHTHSARRPSAAALLALSWGEALPHPRGSWGPVPMWMCVLSSALICNALAWRCSRRRGNMLNRYSRNLGTQPQEYELHIPPGEPCIRQEHVRIQGDSIHKTGSRWIEYRIACFAPHIQHVGWGATLVALVVSGNDLPLRGVGQLYRSVTAAARRRRCFAVWDDGTRHCRGDHFGVGSGQTGVTSH